MTGTAVEAFVALGANLGQPAEQVRRGLAGLSVLPGCTLRQASSLYRTAPVGVVGQPDFINAVAHLTTTLTAHQLLHALLALEAQQGRVRNGSVAPRTLDLDLLLHGDAVLTTPDLTLPHPRLHLRAFVLAPLAEIAPELPLPGRGTVAAWLPAVSLQAIERLP